MDAIKITYPALYAQFKLSGLEIHDWLETQDVYVSTYPHTHHKRGMFYAAVVQCFSQVYYSYYELQSNDTYKWETETVHHTEFNNIKKKLSNATYEQAMEKGFLVAFSLIQNNFH